MIVHNGLSKLLIAVAFASLATGCTGEIRESTSPRTSTEQLLISTSAQRALTQFKEAETVLRGKFVAIDDSHFVSIDKPYVASALREFISEHGGVVIPAAGKKIKVKGGKEIDVKPSLHVEIRNGALGIQDKLFGFGIPALPLPIPNSNLTSKSPSLYIIARDKQLGWAKFQLWIFDTASHTYLAKSQDLWGNAYYSQWTFLGIGPFDFSNDIYPDAERVASGD